MAKNEIRPQAEKISADCPHCGFSQLESPFAKTTICRNCGQGYDIEKLLLKEAESLKGPSLFDKLGKMLSRNKTRDVCCFACGLHQTVSAEAESSMCPQCGSYIDIRDFRIAGPFGRSVQTQGEVEIGPKADVTSVRIACGSAEIGGKMRGFIYCTGDTRVTIKGDVPGRVQTEKFTVEKKAQAVFLQPVHAKVAEIGGQISATILCPGCVTITGKGHFDGVIRAKSLVIEKGAYFSGDLFIGENEPADPDAPDPEPTIAEKTQPERKTPSQKTQNEFWDE